MFASKNPWCIQARRPNANIPGSSGNGTFALPWLDGNPKFLSKSVAEFE